MEEEQEEEEWERQDSEYEGDSNYNEDYALYGQFVEPLFDISGIPRQSSYLDRLLPGYLNQTRVLAIEPTNQTIQDDESRAETSVSKVDEAQAIQAAKDKEFDLIFGTLLADKEEEKTETDIITRKQDSGKTDGEMWVKKMQSYEE